MRNISPAMQAYLLGNPVRTMATCVRITRTDGAVFGFTDHDTDIVYSNVRYASAAGYTASAVSASNNMSTSNMEIDGLMIAAGGAVRQVDVEGGLWSNAAVLIFALNYQDLTMGQVNLNAGLLGQWALQNGSWKVEIRGLAQVMQQTISQQFSATCRAVFGDARCQVPGGLGPLTFAGAVGAIVTPGLVWIDESLTQIAPPSQYVDTLGHDIPTAAPYTVQVVPPSGTFLANTSVVDGGGIVWNPVSGAPTASRQYSVGADGLYTFYSQDAGTEVFIDFEYAMGYFAYGSLKWTGGANAGYTSVVKTFSPGTVTLGLPPPNPVAVGDTYSIVAGCDKQFGTCKSRWNNIVHFRGEPYIPGPDVLLAPQG